MTPRTVTFCACQREAAASGPAAKDRKCTHCYDAVCLMLMRGGRMTDPHRHVHATEEATALGRFVPVSELQNGGQE